MKLPSVRRALAAATAAALVAVPLVMSAPADAGKPKHPPGKPVTVMTRNLYLGADIQRPVDRGRCSPQATPAARRRASLVALANATHVTRAIVDETDFTVRAGLLADEIAAAEPDLIGLQEVALWRHGDLCTCAKSSASRTRRPPTTTSCELLLDALAARGAEYEAVSIATARRRRGAELHRQPVQRDHAAPTPVTSG